jgi:hypothetical protein
MSGGGGDLFGVLPDELLNHVLSFLPSLEAVQSSLLSRRWRHLWRSTAAVRVRGEGDDFRLFVNGLIIHRKATPMRSFEIDADLGTPNEPPYDDPWINDDWRGEVDPHVDLWVTHALRSCNARSLTARFDVDIPWRPRRVLTFASAHLTTVHLEAARLVDGLLDFSCCTALQSLALVRCRLDHEGDRCRPRWSASPSLTAALWISTPVSMQVVQMIGCMLGSPRGGSVFWRYLITTTRNSSSR